jgi:hypothetical protein
MDITRIWVSQRNLRRAGQIPAMIETLAAGETLPRITLIRCEDGEVQVQDGHHRLAAIWLSGRTRLERHEYILLEQDQFRVRCGKLEGIVSGYTTLFAKQAGGESSLAGSTPAPSAAGL